MNQNAKFACSRQNFQFMSDLELHQSTTQQVILLYMSFIRKITKGGYRRKEDSMAYVYSNEDLLKIAQTTDLNTFIKQQQRNYVCHIVRKDNSSIVKRLLFNNNTATKRGPQTTVLSEVLKSEKCTPSELFRSAMQRKHWGDKNKQL